MTEIVALDQGVLWGWAPDGDGYRAAPLAQVRGQRVAMWRQVLAPEPDPRAAVEAGADSLGPYATPAWRFEAEERTVAGIATRRVVASWLEGAQDSVVLEAWIALEAPGAAERNGFDAGVRKAILLDPLLPLGIADQWGPAWLRVNRVLRAAGGMPLGARVLRFRPQAVDAGGDARRILAFEDRFEVLDLSTRHVATSRFEVPASLKLLE